MTKLKGVDGLKENLVGIVMKIVRMQTNLKNENETWKLCNPQGWRANMLIHSFESNHVECLWKNPSGYALTHDRI